MNPVRNLVLALGLALALLSACGNSGDGRPARTTIVLLDRSGSIAAGDRVLYEQSLSAIASDFQGGDRLLVGPVGDEGRGEFRPLLDLFVPETDVRVDQEEAVRAAGAAVTQAMRAFFPAEAGGSRHTRLLAAIAAAAQAFQGRRAGGQLVLMSDGVEDSELGSLEGHGGDPDAVLARARAAGMLPDLTGVSISVVGAGGSNYASVEAFWRAYASATGATISSYGRLPYRPAPPL